MAYRTAVIVGTLCGIAGITTASLAARSMPARDVAAATPVPVIARSAVPIARPVAVDDFHMPPPRVPNEIAGG